MQYIKVTFVIAGQEVSDILIALLADAGYDGFEESGNKLLAYVEQPKFNGKELNTIAGIARTAYETEIVPAQNWNALWESNFAPVVVDNFCTIRAHFHDIKIATPYEILITPKMSFGTGHHATTQLMMLLMKGTNFEGKSVLDFGTGTGVLAILADKLGAAKIIAIDNDEWCVENAIENVERNNCKKIIVKKGSMEDSDAGSTDIILANINRNILLQYIHLLYERLSAGGIIIMSGLLTDDKDAIMGAAVSAGFTYNAMLEQLNWIALTFIKI